MKTFSTLPFLAAFFIAVALMPTNVYQICAREVGTLEIEPWRSAVRAGGWRRIATRALASIVAAFRWLAGGASPTFAAVALVLTTLLITQDASGAMFAIVPVAGLKALRQEAADIKAQITETREEISKLSAKVRGDKREMTEDERRQLNTLKAKIEDLKALQATNAEALQEAEAENERQRTETPVDDADANAARQALTNGRVAVGRDRAEDDPKRGFKDHKDFLGAVMVAGRTGRVDARLKPLQAAQGTDEQSASSDPYGGFLVPHGVAPGILSVNAEEDFIAPLVTNVPMDAPTVSYNARVDKDHTTSVSGGFVVTRRPETVDGTSSRGKFEQITLTANEEFGLAFATERILNDSPASFVAIIAAGFRDEYANNAIAERLRGSGVGERLGVIHANNGSLITVNKENGQAADTIVKENIDNMAARCWRYSRAVWIASNDTRPQLRSIHQVIGTGGVAVPYFTQNPDGAEFLDGRRIYFSEHASKLGDKGDLILAVFSEYLEGEYQAMQTAESIHVRFVAAERCFRFYRRNDGQPWWKTALTPKNGGPTLSPFVTLQAR